VPGGQSPGNAATARAGRAAATAGRCGRLNRP
jgi:hypothetical protein